MFFKNYIYLFGKSRSQAFFFAARLRGGLGDAESSVFESAFAGMRAEEREAAAEACGERREDQLESG